MKSIVYLAALVLTMEGGAAWADKNTVEIHPRSIRIGSTNYHRNHAEAACLGCLGVKRDVARPYFEYRLTWDELGADDLDILDEVVITMDAEMKSEWEAVISGSKNDTDGSIEGSGGQNVAASYTLQKMEISNPGNIIDMINNSEHGQVALSALRSKDHLGIRMITAVWVLVEGSENQGRHFSMAGSASKEGKGTEIDGSGGGSREHNVNFEFSQDTVMAYEMSTIETENCGRRRGHSGPHGGRSCKAVGNLEVDTYRR